MCVCGAHGSQKRNSDSLELKFCMTDPLFGFWDPNLGTQQEQQVLFATDPSPKPAMIYFKDTKF